MESQEQRTHHEQLTTLLQQQHVQNTVDIDQASYHDVLDHVDQIGRMIQDHPYGLPLYILLAQLYTYLAYPDLAVGAAYKALLLSDAIQDESDELHECAWEAFANMMSVLDDKHPNFHAKHDEALVRRKDQFDAAQVQATLTSRYLPQVYRILVHSLYLCGCLRSAFTYSLQARKSLGNNFNCSKLQDTERHIREDVAQHFKLESSAMLDTIEHSPSTWPDGGFVRREQYPWNSFEPDRLEELFTLNDMMLKVAPKLEVLATELPNLAATSEGDDVQLVRQLGVFAKEDIEPGEIVLTEKSILTANNRLQDALCDACNADLPEIGHPEANAAVSCPDCEVIFCDENCMENALELYHPALCDTQTDVMCKDVPATQTADALYSLLLLRALAMAESQQCHPLELKEVKYIWGDFHGKQIEGFSQARNCPNTLPFSFEHNIRLPVQMLENMGIDIFTNQQYDVWVFNTLYAKFRGTASARLSGLGGRPRGPEVSAVHPMWCLANHSCDPNVSWEWGGSIEFRARDSRASWKSITGESIKVNTAGIKKGEEVLNHYCDVDLPVYERREWARGALGGNCLCGRCLWEAGERT